MEINIGIEKYFKCKYHGDKNGTDSNHWFSNNDAIPLKNGFSFDHIIHDFEELFEFTGKEKKFFEVSYDNKKRFFKKLNSVDTFIINKHSTYTYYKSVDELVSLNKKFLFLIDAGDYASIPKIILTEKILNLVKNNFCKIFW